MNRLLKKAFLLSVPVLLHSGFIQSQHIAKIAPGIWKVTYGIQEKYKPTNFKESSSDRGLKKLTDSQTPPVDLQSLKFSPMPQGILARLKMSESERIYGFGLQINSFEQRGMRREIRTSSGIRGNDRSSPHPVPFGNVGMGHAPMPFYISSKGYGVLVNTSRYVTFYMGSQQKKDQSVLIKQTLTKEDRSKATSPKELYDQKYTPSNDAEILVEGARGMEILIFAGPTMKKVMERYNLFSGGGAIPPLWSLGFKYRGKSDFREKEVLSFANYFRDNGIPCDMIGLEPGWQSASYSCSYTWNEKNFPDPDGFLKVIHDKHYKTNLWEHAYVHPSSPIFDTIVTLSANYAVWLGAVPDFILSRARSVFGNYHQENFIKKGISAFKLDECDAAYYDEASAEWSFPDIAQFPSGVDGVQMRQIFGLLYQKVLWDEYKKANRRTMLEVRASHLFAAPYGATIYSDMYNHSNYVTMIANSGFSGVNWSPEVRETSSEDDLVRRMQTILMSSHMVVNCWFLKNLPWKQFDKDKNNRDELLPDYKELERKARNLIRLRMSLIPYLYAAFAKYHFEGTPPFRALVLDFPEDKNVWKTDDQYMMGDNIMCAPFIDGASRREIYFPAGIWYDFNTNKKYEGEKKYTVSMTLDEIPMFVKEGSILPLARPLEYITPGTAFNLTCKVYGRPYADVKLFEDDGETFNFDNGRYNWATLSWNGKRGTIKRAGNYPGKIYSIAEWVEVR